MNPAQLPVTARERFQSNPDYLKAHNAMLDLPTFTRALDVAQLELTRQLAEESKSNPAAAGVKLVGVHQFMEILRNLSRQAIAPAKRPDTNLNHTA